VDSTLYYHNAREEFIEELGGECAVCGKTFEQVQSDDGTLEFHHVDPSKGFESGCGGLNHLVKVRKQYREKGVEIELRCKSCHVSYHTSDSSHHHCKS